MLLNGLFQRCQFYETIVKEKCQHPYFSIYAYVCQKILEYLDG